MCDGEMPALSLPPWTPVSRLALRAWIADSNGSTVSE
jgi:hypothetical protein